MTATATQFGILTNRGSASSTLNPFGYGSGIGRGQDANMGSADPRYLLPRWMLTGRPETSRAERRRLPEIHYGRRSAVGLQTSV